MTGKNRHRGFVYFARVSRGGEDVIKIGYSGSPEKRVRQLAVSSPEPIDLLAVIPGTHDDERHWHEVFADSRMSGEWFRRSRLLVDTISAAKLFGLCPSWQERDA